MFGDELVPEKLSRLFDHFYTKGWIKGYKYSTSSGAVVVKRPLRGYLMPSLRKLVTLMARILNC